MFATHGGVRGTLKTKLTTAIMASSQQKESPGGIWATFLKKLSRMIYTCSLVPLVAF